MNPLATSLLLVSVLGSVLTTGGVDAAPLRFAVLSHPKQLLQELEIRPAQANRFVVVNGIRAIPAAGKGESDGDSDTCSDDSIARQKAELDSSSHTVIISLAAHDWLACPTRNPLPQLRESWFDGDLALGEGKLALTRLSVNRKFKRYPENARWEIAGMLFATINLPADNNHYRLEAGRNGEFEDRQVANRLWLQRLFALVRQKKLRGMVLFSDGNPLQTRGKPRPDGFAEVRSQITQLAGQMVSGSKFLLIDHQPEPGAKAASGIAWRGNIGHISLQPGWHEFIVHTGPHSSAGSSQPLVRKTSNPGQTDSN
jgi:hypothetical protein